MYFSPDSCAFIGLIIILCLIFKGIGNGFSKLADSYHVCPKAFEAGFPEAYCQAMVERGMRFYLGEWIPYNKVNDKDSEELKAELQKKDITLNKHGHWVLTGATLKEVQKKINKELLRSYK